MLIASGRLYCLIVAVVMAAAFSGCSGTSFLKPGKAESRDPKFSSKQKTEEPEEFLEFEKATISERLAKARHYEQADRLERARSIYRELIADAPQRWEPYHRLAMVADRQRRHREAIMLYENALQIKPLDGQILNDLGYSFFLQGNLEKAESALAKAVAVSPAESRFRNNLGLVYGHQGRLEDALETFRIAGSEADAQYNLAFILTSQDKIDAARRCFNLALAADPAFDKARNALTSFERYEQAPDEFVEDERLADGRQWVPYIEGQTNGGVVQASYTTAEGGGVSSGSRDRTAVSGSTSQPELR
jgi:tetratricopeptide (TPR) repeat protein